MVEASGYQYPLKKDHENVMRKAGCDIDRLIEFRRDIHKNAEFSFKEFETQRKIHDMLLSYGIEEENIKKIVGTGLVVDIKGTAPSDETTTGVKCVAIRADLDALPIPECNPDLPYKSVTPFAHMCGHDGHISTILATVQVLAKHRSKIPSNKKVRVLFQPAEESMGGAFPMIKEGCLEGVDEVYGYHNIPNFEEGDVRVAAGAFMAKVTDVKIKVLGQGGHGSAPHMCKDVISAGAAILTNLHTVKSRCIESKENFIFTIT